jgi:hypothetical protein
LTEWRASQAVAAAAGPEVEADGLVQLSAEERLESAAWRDEIAADRQLKLQGLAATLSEVSRQRSRERLAEIFATARDRAVERGW